MKIQKLLSECYFEGKTHGGGFIPDTSTKNYFVSMHPSQWLGRRIKIKLHCIKYEYMTARQNKRIGHKYFLTEDGLNSDLDMDFLADMLINDWVDEHNQKYPYKKISNVKILDIDHNANLILPLQL